MDLHRSAESALVCADFDPMTCKGAGTKDRVATRRRSHGCAPASAVLLAALGTLLAAGCSRVVSLGSLPGTTWIPDGAAPGSPFADPVFRDGLAAWRTPHQYGACAGCHTVDAMDLASLAFSDSAILRYALAQGATEADAWRIVDLVAWQRRRAGITKPLDPLSFRPLQPGGAVLPGATDADRDTALYDYLRSLGLLVAQAARIDTPAQGLAAFREIVALDLRQVRVGIPHDLWSEDPFNGPTHWTSREWLPPVPRSPRAGKEAAWYALHNAYIEDPSAANLWQILRQTETLTDEAGFVTAQEFPDRPGFNGENNLYMTLRAQYNAVQVGGHMLRNLTAQYPDAQTVTAADLAAASTPDYAASDFDVIAPRVGIYWGVGAAADGLYQFWDVLPAFIKTQFPAIDPETGQPPVHPEDPWVFESNHQAFHWYWLGFTYDPAVQFSAGKERTGIFLGNFPQEYPFHHDWASLLDWVYQKFGLDTRYTVGDPGFWRVNGDLSEIGQFSGAGCLIVDARTFQASVQPETRRLFQSNILRAQMYAALDWLTTAKRFVNRSVWDGCLSEWSTQIPMVEATADVVEMQGVAQQISAALDAATETPRLGTQALAAVAPDLNPMRYQPLSLIVPPGADTLPAPAISAPFTSQCGGCHGDDGLGRMQYPALGHTLALADFVRVTRQGRPRGMPAFPATRISDEDLAAAYAGLH